MEHCGLLVRRQEGRANLLYLTPQGRALFDEVVPAHEEHVATLFANLSPGEQSELRISCYVGWIAASRKDARSRDLREKYTRAGCKRLPRSILP